MTKSVFVIGAGASKEFGLPTGDELKQKIAQILTIEIDQFGRIVRSSVEAGNIISALCTDIEDKNSARNRFIHEARVIKEAMTLAPSIDNFLDTHSENGNIVSLGKAAIAQAIAASEASSKLGVDKRNAYNTLRVEGVSDTWIASLFRNLASGRKFAQFKQALDQVSFVSFNYDRCIQQFFFYASQIYFQVNRQDALELVKQLKIKYVYGSLGSFQVSHDGMTNFGDPVNTNEAIKSIRTFTQGTDDGLIDSLSSDFSQARSVFFLGFRYMSLNLEAILGDRTYEVGGVYGTSKGLSSFDVSSIIDELRLHFFASVYPELEKLPHNKLLLSDNYCGEFIREYDRAIAS